MDVNKHMTAYSGSMGDISYLYEAFNVITAEIGRRTGVRPGKVMGIDKINTTGEHPQQKKQQTYIRQGENETGIAI